MGVGVNADVVFLHWRRSTAYSQNTALSALCQIQVVRHCMAGIPDLAAYEYSSSALCFS